MSCKRCGTVPAISQASGEALFSCAVDLLQDKLISMLEAEGFTPRPEGEVVKVAVDSFQGLIATLSRRSDIAEVEADGLNVLFLEEGEQLDFAAFARTKTLKKWLFLLNNRDFIDIFENNSLTTHFQPIVALPNLEIVAYECLSRGVKSDGSLMPPHLLFKLAMENDLLFSWIVYAVKMPLSLRQSKKLPLIFLSILFPPQSMFRKPACRAPCIGHDSWSMTRAGLFLKLWRPIRLRICSTFDGFLIFTVKRVQNCSG